MVLDVTPSPSSDSKWSATAFGPENAWSDGFRAIASLVFGSRLPMLVMWGPELLQVYNDDFIVVLGDRHPRSFGAPAAATWGRTWTDIEPMVREVLGTGGSLLFEDYYAVIERDGRPTECYFTFSVSRIVDERGTMGVVFVGTDATASVLAARSANERAASLAEFQKLADNITDIVYTHGSDGTIGWANQRWYGYTGFDRDTTVTREHWSRLMPATDLARYVGVLDASLSARVPYEIELQLKPASAPASDYRWHLIRAKPMFDDDGFLLSWAGSATDIHDRRIAEGQARERLKSERDREHRASLAFQDAAMPKALPSVPGLTFSAVYEAAEAEALVGGDWYDAFRLSDGRIVLSVGDVMGSGLASAVTMGAVRQSIRGAAQIYPDPASVLDAADRALRSEQPDAIVTAFVAVFDPLQFTMTFASAGHPAPMLRGPGGDVIDLLAPDLPLGLRSEHLKGETEQHIVTIVPGSLLVLYTDGLTESTRDIASGEAKLRHALETLEVDGHGDAARRIRDAVLVSSKDDVAILAVAIGERQTHAVVPGSDIRTSWSFPIVDAQAASGVRREVVAVMRRLGASEGEAADAELVLGELLGNVMRHALGDAQVMLDLTGDAPVLHVIDDGPGFTFHARLPRDTMSESGRGLYIAAMLTRDCNVSKRAEGGTHARVVLNTGPLRT
jgi:PAS domain S-box-containing protein